MLDRPVPYPATIIILAGGNGARMGGADKALLPWGGRSLLEAVAAEARLAAQEILIVGALAACPRDAVIVEDVFPGCGPLGGLHAGLAAARFERCLAVACDMPFVIAGVMRGLLDLGEGYDAAVPRAADGLHPLLAAYSRRCLPHVETQLRNGDRRMRSFFDQVSVRWIGEEELRSFDPDLRCLFNINTRQDYERALEIAGHTSPRGTIIYR
jgi:molybdopterin-guanine dinucleotide biosynthesis protein A